MPLNEKDEKQNQDQKSGGKSKEAYQPDRFDYYCAAALGGLMSQMNSWNKTVEIAEKAAIAAQAAMDKADEMKKLFG